MNILILSSDKKPHLDLAFCKALLDIGHEAQILNPFSEFHPILLKLFLKYPPLCVYPFGFSGRLFKRIKTIKPDIIVLWRPVLFKKGLLSLIRRLGLPIHIVNNDDPFSSVHLSSKFDNWIHLKLRWFHYMKILPMCSWCWFYRPMSMIDYIKKFKKDNCQLFPPFYIHNLHNRNFDLKNKTIDITFAGHFEPDGRDVALLALLNNGFDVRIYGPQSEWTNSCLGTSYDLTSIDTLSSHHYADTLNKSKISLCFLSKINRDGYTRRCFEIPASGSLLVAERTEILEALFIDRKEAFFFDDLDELLSISKLLCHDQALLASSTLAGQKRLMKLRLEAKDVASSFLDSCTFDSIREPLKPLYRILFTQSELLSYCKYLENI